MSTFFDLGPRGFLEKVRADLARLRADTSAETIFDFFVTARHTLEHVETSGLVPKAIIDAIYSDDDFKACLFIANSGKHSIKTTSRGGGSTFADAVPPTYTVYEVTCHGRTIEVRALAERVMQLLERLFNANNIR